MTIESLYKNNKQRIVGFIVYVEINCMSRIEQRTEMRNENIFLCGSYTVCKVL